MNKRWNEFTILATASMEPNTMMKTRKLAIRILSAFFKMYSPYVFQNKYNAADAYL